MLAEYPEGGANPRLHCCHYNNFNHINNFNHNNFHNNNINNHFYYSHNTRPPNTNTTRFHNCSNWYTMSSKRNMRPSLLRQQGCYSLLW